MARHNYGFVTITTFETFVIWAEENGALADGTQEWSFGNGAVGTIGIPIVGDGWEVFAWGFQAENATANDEVVMEFVDYAGFDGNNGDTRTTLATLTTINTGAAGDNLDHFEELAVPIPTPNGTIFSFYTDDEVGVVTDARAVAYFRRPITQTVPIGAAA